MKLQLILASLSVFVACSVRVPTEVPTLSPDARSERGDAGVDVPDAGTLNEAGRWDAAAVDSGSVAPDDGGLTRLDLGFPHPQQDGGPDGGQQSDATIAWPRRDAGPPPPQDDHANSMQNATVVRLGAPTPGRLERSGDEDFFRFMVLEAGWYRIFTRGETDTFCHLLNQAGEEIARDDDSGEGFNCRIERELQAGLYGIRLRHFSGRGTGAYTLHVEGPVDGPIEPGPQCGNGRVEAGEQCDDGNLFPGDGCDPNCRREEEPPPPDDHSNSGADATEVAINERLDGHLERVGDVDYFVVTSAHNQRLLVGTLGATDTRCQAELVQGDVIALDSDSGPGNNCRMSFALRANRPVYLRIEGERNAVRGEYTLFVAVE